MIVIVWVASNVGVFYFISVCDWFLWDSKCGSVIAGKCTWQRRRQLAILLLLRKCAWIMRKKGYDHVHLVVLLKLFGLEHEQSTFVAVQEQLLQFYGNRCT